MRWFKHMSSARNDPAMRKLLAEYGYEGYGVYWSVLEKISENLDSRNGTAATMTPKQWANSGEISTQKFKKIVKFLTESGQFFSANIGIYLKIDCPKLLKYRDEYQKKREKGSGQTPDKLRIWYARLVSVFCFLLSYIVFPSME